MAKIDEIELLKLQNIDLRLELLNREKRTMTQALIAKYGKPGQESIQLSADGTIIEPLSSVPESA